MAHKKDFNYRITEFFLNKTRLTILSLFLLIVIGIFTTLSLKTVGFPNPEIRVALISTAYPGAGAGTVLSTVTEPLQQAIEDVDGVDTYRSNTQDSFSSIFVTLKSDANSAGVRSSLKDAVAGVNLPAGVEKSNVTTPEIRGADVYLSLYQPNEKKRYRASVDFENFVKSLEGTESVEQENKYTQRVIVALDPNELQTRGLTTADIERAITTVEEQLPVASNVTLDGKQQSIVTSLEGELTLENLADITLTYHPPKHPSLHRDRVPIRTTRFTGSDVRGTCRNNSRIRLRSPWRVGSWNSKRDR